MTDALPIPAEYVDLFSLLRCAVHKRPPDVDLSSFNWSSVLKQARQHGVDTFLYPWLSEHCPRLFSAKAEVAESSAPAAWRALFLKSVSLTVRRQRQLTELLGALARASIPVIPLKGAWLSETVYDDPACRSMSDIDLLLRECDLELCHTLFISLGYIFDQKILQNPFYYEQHYYHPRHPYIIETHWQFTSRREPALLPPDISAIWSRSTEGRLLGQPVRLMSRGDQLAHLAQHVLRHGFAMHLRGYLDIALLMQHVAGRLDANELSTASSCWKIGRGLIFIMAMASDIYAFPRLAKPAAQVDLKQSEKYALAFSLLFNLPVASERKSEVNLFHLKQVTPFGRLKLLLNCIFLPPVFLATLYPCARHPCGLPLAWLCRLVDLIKRYHDKIDLSLSPTTTDERTLAHTENRESIIKWLLE